LGIDKPMTKKAACLVSPGCRCFRWS